MRIDTRHRLRAEWSCLYHLLASSPINLADFFTGVV